MQSSLVAVSSEYLYENHLSIKIRDLRHDIVILQDTYYNEDRRTGGDCMRNHEVTQRHPLLDEHGRLKEAGWSRSLLQEYRREDIKAKRWRIKEWDYYLILNDHYGVAFTISDDGYIGLQSVSLLDFKKGWEHTETNLNAFPMGKLKLPTSSESGSCKYRDKRLDMEFKVMKGKRILRCDFQSFYEGKPFHCEITLHQPDMDSMVIATPWKEKKTAFYYNQKINCMRAEGSVSFDGNTIRFDPQNAFGTLDWGRGVWTYDNTWYWGNGNGLVEGKPFGFNVGYGFGDTTAASENLLLYDGVAYKLEDVTFHIPPDSYLKPWRITSSDARFEMSFQPILDRCAKTSALIIVTDQHQVFGYLSGTAVLDDGRVLKVKDMLCFFEKVHNRY